MKKCNATTVCANVIFMKGLKHCLTYMYFRNRQTSTSFFYQYFVIQNFVLTIENHHSDGIFPCFGREYHAYSDTCNEQLRAWGASILVCMATAFKYWLFYSSITMWHISCDFFFLTFRAVILNTSPLSLEQFQLVLLALYLKLLP